MYKNYMIAIRDAMGSAGMYRIFRIYGELSALMSMGAQGLFGIASL
jgi:hypothetical protein